MAFTPDPNLFNRSFGGGLQNAKSLLGMIEERQKKSKLQEIASSLPQNDPYEVAGSKLIELGMVQPGLSSMNIPYNREQQRLQRDFQNQQAQSTNDFRSQTLDLQRQKLVAANDPNNPSNRVTYGKTPAFHMVNGVLRYGQFGDDGSFKAHDDINAVEPITKVDTGIGTQLRGSKTGQKITPDISKNVVETEAQKASGKQAVEISGKAVERLGKIRENIGNLTAAIKALDDGANTGAIAKYFPSMQKASIELSNIQNRLGLDVIGDVTFGALSKGELDLALSTALPTGMAEKPLREWLTRKKEAQEKYSKILSETARFLSKPGNTLNDWLEIKGINNQSNNGLINGVTKNGIKFTVDQ